MKNLFKEYHKAESVKQQYLKSQLETEDSERLISNSSSKTSQNMHLNTEGSHDEEETNWLEWIPLTVCLLIFFAIVLFICIDYHGAMKILEDMCDYIKDHPYEAIGIVMVIYVFMILFLLPITVLHLMVAFAYCKVYDDFWSGFWMSTGIIFVASMLGAVVALFLGRWLFADYIRNKLDKSKSPKVKKWRVIDSMFVTSGIMLVALLRLMFIPFGLVSYMLGVTSVAFWDYFLGTTAIIIKIMLIVLVGCTIWQASEEARKTGKDEETNANEIIILVVEILATIIITVIVTIWAKNTLDEKFAEVEKEERLKAEEDDETPE